MTLSKNCDAAGHRNRRPIYWLACALIVAAPQFAHAENAENGLRLSRALCVNCHSVEPGGAARQFVADVPSFMAIATKPGQSADRMQGYILTPHPPMPQVQLTKNELADIAAYVMTLKK